MQKQHSASRVLVAMTGLAAFIAAVLFSAHLAGAQGAANLLQNPGFEGTYVAFQGDPSRMMAPSWTPWNVLHKASDAGFVNLQPQYQPAQNPKRIRSGSAAQEYLTFFATHDGGVLQRVATTAGTKLKFSVWVNVWSTSLDDPDASEQPGRLTVRAGIDPLGGSDGTSPNIVWTAAPEVYDQYQQINVEAVAKGQFVTVFVESNPKDPVKNNNTYVDDASLVAEGSVPVPTVTPSTTPTTQSTVAQPTAAQPTAAPTTAIPATAVSQAPTATSNPFVPTREGTIVAGPSDTPLPLLPTNTSVPVESGPTNTSVPLNTVQPQPTAASNKFVITVAPGDTLSSLAARYNTTPEEIAVANGISTDGLIFVGQSLVIPAQTVPTVVAVNPTSATGGAVQGQAPVLSAALTGPTVNGIGTYIMQRGDTFAAVAQRYGLSVEALAQLNGIVNPNSVPVGTVLVVPGPGNNYPGGTIAPTVLPSVPAPAGQTTHTVAPGENLFRISLKYNVTLQALMQANGISNPNLIYVGQVLRIP